MTDLQAIAALYEEIDNTLESLRASEPVAGDGSEPSPHHAQAADQRPGLLRARLGTA